MPITYAEHKRWLAVRDQMLATLREAASRRAARDQVDPITGEPAWVAYERHVMHLAVNRQRRALGLPFVELGEIAKVEQLACGHIDYADKYALYCAELAVGITPRELEG